MKSQGQLVDEFVAGKEVGSASNMSIGGDTLYSYWGFLLMVRTPEGMVANSDKYSVSTSQHQELCLGKADITLSFSTMDLARIPIREFKVVDKRKESWVETGKWCFDTEEGYLGCPHRRRLLTQEQFKVLPSGQQDHCYRQEEHIPEAIVLYYEGKWYLSSTDEDNYFLCELPKRVTTVDRAYESLIPLGLKNKEYQRQGEWFFVEVEPPKSLLWKKRRAKTMYRHIDMDYALPRDRPYSHSHIATRGSTIDGKFYVSGSIKHPEHRMLRLSRADDPKIFQALRNRAVNSWSSRGRVD